MIPRILTNCTAQLGEGPVWDEREQVLWWTDITDGKIFRTAPDGGQTEAFEIGEPVGTIGLRENGGLILATAVGFATYDPKTQTLKKLVDPEADKPNNRFNDGKPDPSGSFYAGTMPYDQKEGAGAFYRLKPDGEVVTVRENVTISNGLAWNGRQDTLYYIDTPRRLVTAYDYDKKSGHATKPRDIFEISEDLGHPDGMTIDSEDKLWIAHYGGSAVRRWDPESGELLQSIKFPATQITCCTFGGVNMDKLFVTSASQGLSDEEIEKQSAGALFVVETPYRGLAPFRFKG